MSIDQKIILASTLISLTGVIFSYLSVRRMGKQIDIQKRQWEYSCTPIFRISYITEFNQKSICFVIENSNNVYHQVEEITFPSDTLTIKDYFYGNVTSSEKSGGQIIDKKEYHGLLVTMEIKDSIEVRGRLRINGVDMLGNKFKVETKELVFKNYKLDNHLEISKTYLKST